VLRTFLFLFLCCFSDDKFSKQGAFVILQIGLFSLTEEEEVEERRDDEDEDVDVGALSSI
jgi:hypothetical protein